MLKVDKSLIYCITCKSQSKILHSYGDVTMSLKGCKDALEQGGGFLCHYTTPDVTLGPGFCGPISRLYDKPRPILIRNPRAL